MKDKTKKTLYVTGKLSGKATRIGIIVTLGLFFTGWVSNFALDLIERRELKEKIKQYNNAK